MLMALLSTGASTLVDLLAGVIMPLTYQYYNELAEEFVTLLNDKECYAFNII